jgi:hypothetical protein
MKRVISIGYQSFFSGHVRASKLVDFCCIATITVGCSGTRSYTFKGKSNRAC